MNAGAGGGAGRCEEGGVDLSVVAGKQRLRRLQPATAKNARSAHATKTITTSFPKRSGLHFGSQTCFKEKINGLSQEKKATSRCPYRSNRRPPPFANSFLPLAAVNNTHRNMRQSVAGCGVIIATTTTTRPAPIVFHPPRNRFSGSKSTTVTYSVEGSTLSAILSTYESSTKLGHDNVAMFWTNFC